MTRRLTEARLRELRRVRDEGRFKRGGEVNRREGLTEYLWKLRDGRLIGDSQVSEGWYEEMRGATCVGQRLTEAGRAALSTPIIRSDDA